MAHTVSRHDDHARRDEDGLMEHTTPLAIVERRCFRCGTGRLSLPDEPRDSCQKCRCKAWHETQCYMSPGLLTAIRTVTPGWQPIITAPCDDTWAIVRYKDGTENFEDLDHDSDPQWFAERGATHWRLPTEAETTAFWAKNAGVR